MNLRELREKRANKIKEAQGILDKSRGEKRSLTPEEKTLYDNLLGEIDVLKEDITREERAEELAAEQAGQTTPLTNTHTTTEARSIASYSLLKAVRSVMPGGAPLEGIEKEMHQQAVTEARAAGESVHGVGIPQMLLTPQRRDNSITMPTQPQDGSAVMYQDTVRPIIDLARPRTVLRELGATFLTGLTGNIGVPSLASGAVSTWKAEVAELDKSNQTFSDAEMKPHRLGTYAIRSKQFLIQTAPSVEALLRQDLENSIAQALELAAITGTGANNQPLGLLLTSGIGAVALGGANGGPVSRGTLVALEAAVESSNINTTTLGYLINIATKAALKNTKTDAGSGIFLLDSNDTLNGYPYRSTTNVPKNLTVGTTAGAASAAIFGDWSKLLIGQWGGLDLTVDPYTLATNGQIRIIIQSFYDVLVAQAAAFAVAKDITTN
ncbi:MAG: phage major capsid protein [Janthinobacterium lividum]